MVCARVREHIEVRVGVESKFIIHDPRNILIRVRVRVIDKIMS